MKLNLHFDTALKLTLLLVLMAILLPAAMGGLNAYRGNLALQAASGSELLAMAIEKQAALDAWIVDRQADLAALATAPHVLDDLASLSAAPASPSGATASAGLEPAAHDHLIADLRSWTGPNQAFLALTVIEPEHGQVIASTDPGEEGQFREDRAYFISGKAGPTVQTPQDTGQGWAMFVAAPLRSPDGRLLGVLAGRLNLTHMNAIVGRHTGLRQTADAYLVNTSNLLVTQPRFVTDPATLQRGIHTEAAERCLARTNGEISADDYRGAPTISVYRWLPQIELCLIAEMSQSETLAASRSFGMTMLLIAGQVLFALSVSLVAVALARGIARPVHQLVRGAQEIGKGNLAYRITMETKDELGQLADAFNEMAANLRTSLGETARGQRLLAALSQAAQTVQRAQTPEEVYRTVGEEVARLGYREAIIALTDDGMHLSMPYLNFDPALQRTAERLVGITAADLRVKLTPGGFYQRALAGGETVFLDPFLEPVTEAVPGLLRPLIGQLTELLGIKQGIVAPLRIGGEVRSLLMVTGEGLNADDVLAVKTFANQTAIALENARLFQETRAWAAELEQRVQAQTETIRATEERLRTVVTNAPIVLWATDREGKFTLVEGKGLEPLRRKPSELVGQSVFEVHRAVPATPEDNRRALHGETFASTVEVAGLVFDTHNAPMRDANGQVIGVTGVSVDITERKRMEEALHENMHFVESVADATPDIIYVYDLVEQRPVYNNRQIAEVLGYTPAEIQALGAAFLPAKIHSDDWPIFAEASRHLATIGDGDVVSSEYRMRDARGEWRWFADRTLIFSRTADGTPRQILGTSEDITARKRAEEQLASTAAELARSNTELERFAYIASHDLQEPLRMISGFMGLLAQRYQGKLDTDADEFIGFAIDGAQRMQRLINGLLDYSRVGTRGQTPEPIDASAVVKDALWNLELAIQDAGATVTCDPLPTVMADRNQLTQLFQNLIGNAVKFRGAEPPCVHVSVREASEPSETSKVPSKVWAFAVRDNGIGIAPEHRDQIFGIFQRLHSQEEYPGTGIGLAICKKIVEHHGGGIWVESQPGQGSSFCFTLPARGNNE